MSGQLAQLSPDDPTPDPERENLSVGSTARLHPHLIKSGVQYVKHHHKHSKCARFMSHLWHGFSAYGKSVVHHH